MKREGNPKLAVGYVRVSTEDQSLGPQAQRLAIERWAAGAGVQVVAIHDDLGLSGGLPAEMRPGLLAALASVVESGAGLLVAAKRDRIARDVVIAATVEQLAKDAGARVVTADGISAEDTPEGQFMRTIMDAFAAYERALIRARTKAALAVKKSRGERTGSVPFGYRLTAGGTTLVESMSEQTVIDLVRTMRAEGVSYRGIVKRLNAGVAPSRGRRWHLATVQRILAS